MDTLNYFRKISDIIGQDISYFYRINSEPTCVYHYTSLEGLKGIISNDSFYFTNSLSLNDKSEGKDIFPILDILRKNLDISEEFRTMLNCITWESLVQNSDLNFYVLSFCKDKDNLSMWNYYAKSNNSIGVNLGLDLKELTEKFIYYLDEEIPVRNDNLNWWHTYGSVIYDDDKKYQILKNIIVETEMEMKNGNKDEVYSVFISLLRMLSLFFKNHHFKIENEYRFVIALSREQLKSYIQRKKKEIEDTPIISLMFRSSGTNVQPCLNVPLLKKWKYPHIKILKTVTLSPTFNETSKYGLQELLNFYDYSYTEILKSEIPMR